MKKLFAMIIIAGLAFPAVAQISPYLEKGKNGFGLNAGYEQGHSFKGFVGKLGYSYKGAFDLEVAVNADGYDRIAEELTSDDASSLGILGIGTWWVLRAKPGPVVDVNFGLTAGIESFTYKKYTYLPEPGADPVEYKGYLGGLFGIETNLKFNMSDNWSLMPRYAVVYDIGNETTIDQAFGEYSSSYSGFMSRIGVSLSKKLDTGNVVYLDVNQFFDTYDSSNYFEAKIGFIFSQK